jgi:hypothetical protein
MNRVKVSFNKETKRVPSTVTNYGQLIEFIKFRGFKETDLASLDFKLYYQDEEGDFISIGNEEEFNEALNEQNS